MSKLTIDRVHAWEALDSRGRPTVACKVRLEGGHEGRAIVPSGASTGTHEAVERRDGGDRYLGFGVLDAVNAVNTTLAPLVIGELASDRVLLDDRIEAFDGEPGHARLGANAALAMSLAITIANAAGQSIPLWRSLTTATTPLIPMPMVNILSGGAHAGRAIDLQDFLAVPLAAPTFAEAIEWIARVRSSCADLLDAAGGWSALVADEGGLSARLTNNEEALKILTCGIERAGFDPGKDVAIAIDVAANQLTVDGRIVLTENRRGLSAQEWTSRLLEWVDKYPIISIEDPFAEDAWDPWRDFTRMSTGLQVLGDDLIATNPDRLQEGIDALAANAVLVKVNQAGSVSRAERTLKAAQSVGWGTVVSARSGDTEDHWLADLAVGWNAGQIKVGSTMRSERTAKWNRLLEIESEGVAELAHPERLVRSSKLG